MRSGYLDERGREALGEELEVGAAAVVKVGERPILAGSPGGGEAGEDDGEVGLHEAVDKLRVSQRPPVHPLHLPHHLHAAAGAAAVHLVQRGGAGLGSFRCFSARAAD